MAPTPCARQSHLCRHNYCPSGRNNKVLIPHSRQKGNKIFHLLFFYGSSPYFSSSAFLCPYAEKKNPAITRREKCKAHQATFPSEGPETEVYLVNSIIFNPAFILSINNSRWCGYLTFSFSYFPQQACMVNWAERE